MGKKWNFTNDQPIYLQIMKKIKFKIISGEWEPGERTPTVKDLSAEAGVNPNTMQRAFAELEREGYVHADRTYGRYVTDDEDLIHEMKKEVASNKLKRFMKNMKTIGFTKEQIVDLVKNYNDN